MALFRQLSRAPRLVRQCSKIVTTQTQTRRNYADMPLIFASPSEVFFNGDDVKQIDAVTIDSAVGIMPNHVPLMSVLRPGVVKVFLEDGGTRDIFVSSGSLTVNPDGSVQILAEEATDVANLSSEAARSGLDQATREMSEASTETKKMEKQIEIDAYTAILSAC